MFNPWFAGMHYEIGLRDLVGGLVIYIYIAYTVMILARRLHLVKDSWWAWVPIANLLLLTKMAAREWWWIIGFVIPFVNIFVTAFLWAEIARRLGRNPWIGAVIVLPFIGIFVPGYLVVTTPEHHGTGHHHDHSHHA
jgi:hypothetical protein